MLAPPRGRYSQSDGGRHLVWLLGFMHGAKGRTVEGRSVIHQAWHHFADVHWLYTAVSGATRPSDVRVVDDVHCSFYNMDGETKRSWAIRKVSSYLFTDVTIKCLLVKNPHTLQPSHLASIHEECTQFIHVEKNNKGWGIEFRSFMANRRSNTAWKAPRDFSSKTQ